MAISYPLSLPSDIRSPLVEMRAINAVAVSASPFSFDESRYSWGGEMWQADITLRAMHRAEAEQWISFLVSLRGQFGAFLLGDPMGCRLQGTATSVRVTGSAGDRSVSATISGALVAGDYIQLGSGSDATLHKVLVGRSGSGTLEIWPALRKARSNSLATISNAKGVFRLATNETGWTVNEVAAYGITFPAVEVI